MRRITQSLVLVAGVVAAVSASAQQKPFSYRGLTLGMSAHDFITAVGDNGWMVPSYTLADGRGLFRAIEYQGLPTLDSMADEVIVESNRSPLAEGSDITISTIKARFCFGRLAELEMISDNGQERLFRAFSLAAMREVEFVYGPADRKTGDVETFFSTFNLDNEKPFVQIPIASWKGDGYSARITIVRMTDRQNDYPHEEKGVFSPWGTARLFVAQGAPELAAKWETVKADLRARQAQR
jgi:hypothetical protein